MTVKTKQGYLDELTDLLDQPRFRIPPTNGSSLPAYAFQAAARLAGVTYSNMPQAAEDVILAAGLGYDYESYDSRHTKSRGGGTVSKAGMAALVTAVERLIERNCTDVELTPESGQGRVYDPIRRRKIEDAAQDWLMAHYRRQGFDVTDTRVGRPYDAEAVKGPALLHLEAKGATSDASTVVVTRNEVAWARGHLGQCVMGIWSGIVFDAHGEVNPRHGQREIYDWAPDEPELEPRDYDWRVPQSKQMWPRPKSD